MNYFFELFGGSLVTLDPNTGYIIIIIIDVL